MELESLDFFFLLLLTDALVGSLDFPTLNLEEIVGKKLESPVGLMAGWDGDPLGYTALCSALACRSILSSPDMMVGLLPPMDNFLTTKAIMVYGACSVNAGYQQLEFIYKLLKGFALVALHSSLFVVNS